jgi:hypothetical protein
MSKSLKKPLHAQQTLEAAFNRAAAYRAADVEYRIIVSEKCFRRSAHRTIHKYRSAFDL